MIVGRGGAKIKWLKESTGANIFVPRADHQRQRPQQLHRNENGHEGMQQQDEFLQQPQSTTVDSNNAEGGEVPTSQQQTQIHPVRVNSSQLPNLLNAFYEISLLLSQDSDNDNLGDSVVPCVVKMRVGTNSRQRNDQQITEEVNVDGQLLMQNSSSNDFHQPSLIFRGSIVSPSNNNDDQSSNDAVPNDGAALLSSSSANPQPPQLCAYGMRTPLSEEDVATVVDNLRFVDSSVDSCQWFYRVTTMMAQNTNNDNDGQRSTGSATAEQSNGEENRQNLVFVFGDEGDNPESICQAIRDAAAS